MSFKIEFSWSKYKAFVIEQTGTSDPIYTVDIRHSEGPPIVFRNARYDSVIGTATLPPLSIDATYELHGAPRSLNGLNRFHTEYSYLSYNYSDNDAPVKMTWRNKLGIRSWDMVCNDENQNPVARFKGHPWALKKWGEVELIGPKSGLQATREEILVTGFTLFLRLLSRTSGIMSLFGATVAKTGPAKSNGMAPAPEHVRDTKDASEIDGTPVSQLSEMHSNSKEFPHEPYELPAQPHGGSSKCYELP